MATKAPREDFDDSDIAVEERKDYAAGVPAVAQGAGDCRTSRWVRSARAAPCSASTRSTASTAPAAPGRTRTTAPRPSSARTAPRRSPRRRPCAGSRREFFAEHSLGELAEKTDWWLGQQGRLTHPVDPPRGLGPLRGDRLGRGVPDHGPTTSRPSPSPDEAVFYTSGRTSNEAAFLYQLLVRGYGTNNLPDCSNMCHESSGSALGRDDRRRQGLGVAGGRPRGRADRRGGPEPRHQPPTHAERAAEGQEERRGGRRRQPAARGRAHQVQEPAVAGQRPHGDRAEPTTSCRSASAATWRCSRPSGGSCWTWRPITRARCWTRRSSTSTPAASTPTATASPTWTGTRC